MSTTFPRATPVPIASLCLSVATACTPAPPPTAEVLIQTVEVEVTRVIEITSTPAPSHTPTPLPPMIFQEDFESGPNEWTLTSSTEGSSLVTDGHLVLTVDKPNWTFSSGHPDLDFLNPPFDLSVAITSLRSPRDAYAAIGFRYFDEANSANLYLDGNGFVSLGEYFEGAYYDTIPWTRVAGISRGTNLLRLVDLGNRLVAYANGNLLFDMPFETLGPGGVYFFVGAFADAHAEWAFDDIVVRQLAP